MSCRNLISVHWHSTVNAVGNGESSLTPEKIFECATEKSFLPSLGDWDTGIENEASYSLRDQ